MKNIPYGHQKIDGDDIKAVVKVLKSEWLTQGPKIKEFEDALCRYTGAKYAVAVSSGTAALHAAMYSLGIKAKDEVLVPAITFVATANAVVFQGGKPVFVDVDPATLLIDPANLKKKISRRTKAIIAVDYAGHPCDYDIINDTAKRYGLPVVADACHALGAEYKRCKVGTLAKLNVFSFHPVKHITCGEGGMVTTNDRALAQKVRLFRNHGISTDFHAREKNLTWCYEMVDLGYNYRLTDFQAALGLSQLSKLPVWLKRRREIAKQYDSAFKNCSFLKTLDLQEGVKHAYHLYVVRLNLKSKENARLKAYHYLRNHGIGVNVHYLPVYLHPFYRKVFGTKSGLCPNAESAYKEIISLPIFPGMSNFDVIKVINSIRGLDYLFSGRAK